MKKLILFSMILFVGLISFTSCVRVAPNHVGVLMENYGKDDKADYSLQTGRVNTMGFGKELFQVPLWEQRADFGDRILHLKSSDNTEFTSKPMYAYKIIKKRAIDVVFDNKHLGEEGDAFMRSLEDNILETKIYDLMSEELRKYTTDELMVTGGNLNFENKIQIIIRDAFEKKGLQLEMLSCKLEYSEKVKEKLDIRNESKTNISAIDQQILEQNKRNELAELKAKENLILSKGLTKEVLTQHFIDKWEGGPIYGNTPITNLISK